MIRISRGSRPPMPALYRGDHFNTRLLGVWPYCGMWLPSQCRACICLVCLHPRIGADCRIPFTFSGYQSQTLWCARGNPTTGRVSRSRNQIRTKALLATRREEKHHD
jgi:hypothetical protein